MVGWAPPAEGLMSRCREPEIPLVEFLADREERNAKVVNGIQASGDDELDAEVSDWAERLAAGPPLALAMTKRMLTLNASNDFKSALEAEGMAQTVNFYTSDTKEAVAAFLDKREPKFQGN